MSSRRWAIVILTVLPGIFIGIDIALALNAHDGDTYSEIIRSLWWQFPVLGVLIVILFGVLAGHWFKPKPDKNESPRAWALGLNSRPPLRKALLFAAIAAAVFFLSFVAGSLLW